MGGRASAVQSGAELEAVVRQVGQDLGLSVRRQVRVGRRLWGAVRKIDIILTERGTRRTLGIECKYQAVSGSAEEKIPATVQDIQAWPIPGIVVVSGPGFSDNLRQYLYSTGKAVDLEDLRVWLELFFGLEG